MIAVETNNELLRTALGHIESFFARTNPAEIGGAAYRQTLKLSRQCSILATRAGLSQDESINLQLAALFLFTGQLDEGLDEQFETAAMHMDRFCAGQGMEPKRIALVRETMLGAAYPQMPASPAAQVLCDGLNSGVSEKQFVMDGVSNVLTDPDTILYFPRSFANPTEKLNFLVHHLFFTNAARKQYEKGKAKNIERLEKQMRVNGDPNVAVLAGGATAPIQPDEGDTKMERGSETLFRITSRRHTELLSMAHQKAGLLVSVNAIIFSVVISVLSTQLDEHPGLLLPTALLIVTCVSTIVISILSTKPKIVDEQVNPQTFQGDGKNILFFGHYSALSWPEYRKVLRQTIVGKELLFDALAKDIYYQGIVLDKKYRLLSIAYLVFLIGLVLSTLAFLINIFQ